MSSVLHKFRMYYTSLISVVFTKIKNMSKVVHSIFHTITFFPRPLRTKMTTGGETVVRFM